VSEEEKSPHGLKTSAGMMLSKFLRQIGQERTEVAGSDTETGQPRLVSKAEQLARTIWQLALGWKEEVVEEDLKTSHKKRVVKEHKPDNTMISLVFDRLEGKVAATESEKSKKQPLSQRVNDQAKKRVNALVGESDDGGDS